MKLKLTSIICFLLLIFLSGCEFSSSSVISDKSCSPPCWRNIQPGKSTKNELLAFLQKMPDLKTGSIRDAGSWQFFDDDIYFDLNSKETGETLILNDKVVIISFNNIANVKFRDAIKKYGDPKYIQNVQIQGDFFGPAYNTYITAISPESGIAYGFENHQFIHLFPEAITPDTGIQWIYYFDPDSYQNLRDKGMIPGGIPLDPIYFHPWQGYGTIATKYP